MASLQTRVVNILKDPAREWPVIAAETDTVGRLYREYIIPLALLPVIARIVGLMWFTGFLAGYSFGRTGLVWTLLFAVVGYAVELLGLYIAAVIIEWLAPKFKSSGTRVDALKIAAYAMTPVWIAGIAQIVPFLGGLLMVVGLIYAIYLCYVGLPHVLKTPQDQVAIFMIVAAAVIIVVRVALAAILSIVLLGGSAPFLFR